MKIPVLLVGMALIGPVAHPGYAQTMVDTTQNRATKPIEKKYQAKAPKTQPFGSSAFGASRQTTIRWLGFAGFFVNSRGTTFMVDPVLEGFDMPVLIDFPIAPKAVPKLNAVLVTHADNDHFSVPTNQRSERSYQSLSLDGLC